MRSVTFIVRSVNLIKFHSEIRHFSQQSRFGISFTSANMAYFKILIFICHAAFMRDVIMNLKHDTIEKSAGRGAQ